MSAIPRRLRRLVIQRARGRCEYCRLAQAGQAATFHIDHINPSARGGITDLDNLALACVGCSLRKGVRQESADPRTGVLTPLFNPRRHVWSRHFRWRGLVVIGRTAVGRATVEALQMNHPRMTQIRREEAHRRRHPPPGTPNQD